MSELLTVPRASFQKQILIQVDKFFRHEQQEAWIPETSFVCENSEKVDVNLNRAKYKHDTPIRLHNAITQLTEAVLLMLKKEGTSYKKDFIRKLAENVLVKGKETNKIKINNYY